MSIRSKLRVALALLCLLGISSWSLADGISNQTPAGAVPNFTTSFLFSGSATTAVPATSASYANPPANTTVNVTAGSGVTSLTAQVQATADNSNWTTIGTVNLTAPGSGYIIAEIPYLALRVNVTALSGGNASANLTSGQSPLAASGGTVLTNPSLTGVPVPGPYIFAQSGIPVILPSSGSIANNGVLTLTTALPTTFANSWMFFPTGAIFAGSSPGVYFVQMSSATAGTIFNNVLASGGPFIPTSPTPFVTTGPGAYTQTNGGPTLVSLPLLGGSLGNNGALRFKMNFLRPNNANVVAAAVNLGGVQAALANFSSALWVGLERTLRNMGSQAAQVTIAAGSNFQTDANVSGSATSFLTVNTAITQNVDIIASLAVSTDYCILAGYTFEVLPGN